MFKIGDLIVYGNTGVCKVEKVGPLDTSSGMGDREYYTLKPYYGSGSIYTPVDNTKVVMRSMLKKKEAEKLLEDIEDIDKLEIPDEKHREQSYKDAIASADCYELVKLIKTIYPRSLERIKMGKKVTAHDERYYKMAEDFLLKEMALVFNKSIEDTKDYILKKIPYDIKPIIV